MSYQFDLADVRFLRSDAGFQALAEAAELPLTPASRLADVAAVRRLAGEHHAAAVLETVVLRRRAVSKMDDPVGWLFTDAALQQATATAVARHRAARLVDRVVHDVTCSIGADLAVVAEVARRCVGSDLDQVRLAMAEHNCAVAGVAPLLVRADALRPVTRDAVVLADPARRDVAGQRKWRPEQLMPPLGELVAAYRHRDLAVKCAPGLDLDAVGWADEVELVSLDGQVREACLWTGSLATAGVRRRATVLRTPGLCTSGAGTSGLRTSDPQWTITDAESDECPVRSPGQWLVDPDGAVVRAGLVRHYAARHGLGQLDPRIAYLTGDTPPPGVRAFRILEHGRYTEKTLRARLRAHEVGRLEILVRGLPVDPNTLRPRLKLAGPAEATVVLTRIDTTPTAFLCQAVRT